MRGPNVNKLIVHKFLLLAIRSEGRQGLKFFPLYGHHPFQAVMGVLLDADKIKTMMKEAERWVDHALETMRSTPDNPYPDDEAIAEAILQRPEEVRAEMDME